MPIVFCSHCGKKMRAPESAVGKRGLCPTCGTLVEIANTSAGVIASGSETQPNEDRFCADAGAPSSSPSSTSPPTTTGKVAHEDEQSRVERLAALYRQGNLSKEEYETLKKKAFREATHPPQTSDKNGEMGPAVGVASILLGRSWIMQTWTRLSIVERRVTVVSCALLFAFGVFLMVTNLHGLTGIFAAQKARLHGEVRRRSTGTAWEGRSLLICRRYVRDRDGNDDLLRLSEEFTEEFQKSAYALSRSLAESAGSLRAGSYREANSAINEGVIALHKRKSVLGAMQRRLDTCIAAARVACVTSGREGKYECCGLEPGDYIVGHPVELPLLMDNESDTGKSALSLMGVKAVVVDKGDVRLDMDSMDE